MKLVVIAHFDSFNWKQEISIYYTKTEFEALKKYASEWWNLEKDVEEYSFEELWEYLTSDEEFYIAMKSVDINS